jgi:hypothetical protein
MKRKFLFGIALIAVAACGSQSSVVNLFPQKLDPADRAAKYLEQGKPEQARSLLLKELGTDFTSAYDGINATNVTDASTTLSAFITTPAKATLASLLASAEAQILGLDPIELILKSKNLTSGSGQSSNIFISMWPILPAATNDSILTAQKATAALISLSAFYIKEDTLKLTMFQLAATSLSLKIADTNGNNQLDPSEIASLSLESASLILSQIASAALAAASINSETGTNEAQVASKISDVATALAQSQGSDNQQKVQSWLGTLSQ